MSFLIAFLMYIIGAPILSGGVWAFVYDRELGGPMQCHAAANLSALLTSVLWAFASLVAFTLMH